jgi:prevent-host-death family protein
MKKHVRSINIHEAKTHLSRLVEEAANGETFVIAKAGKPMVKVLPLDAPADTEVRRLGFLGGRFAVLEDLDSMCSAEIEKMFSARK